MCYIFCCIVIVNVLILNFEFLTKFIIYLLLLIIIIIIIIIVIIIINIIIIIIIIIVVIIIIIIIITDVTLTFCLQKLARLLVDICALPILC